MISGNAHFGISLDNVAVTEPVNGHVIATFHVKLSGSNHAVDLDGTAYAGTGYAHTATPLTFQPGETVKTFSVPAFADPGLEDDEIFYVQVTGHDGDAFIANDTDGEATIKNTGGSDVIFSDGFE